MRHTHWLTIVLLAIVLAACKGPAGTTIDDGMHDESIPPADTGGATSSGIDSGGFQDGSELGNDGGSATADLDNRVVYFEFDKSDVSEAYTAVLEAHARHLANNPSLRLRLEGHADERGSREYNIGLGERRAQAVKRILMLQGAGAGQLSTVSYGEERPAALGSDEEVWALNRRVELVYEQ